MYKCDEKQSYELKMYLLSPPILCPEIYHLNNELHPKQSRQHQKDHSQKKPSQHCMRKPLSLAA